MNRIREEKGLTEKKSTENSWNSRRKLINNSIPLEIDLDKREIIIQEAYNKIPVRLATTNIDSFIKNHVHPNDLDSVIESLENARRGIEKPITFNFVHPKVSLVLPYEYHYQIEYARYSQTKLNGVLRRSSKKKK